MHQILTEIFKDTSFTEPEEALILKKLKKKTLIKGEFLLKAGDSVRDFFYIHTGCLRTYFVDDSGKEHTLQFAVKGWWISDYIALFGQGDKLAVSNIECIKDAIIYGVSKKDFDTLLIEIPLLSQIHIQNMEYSYAHAQQRKLESLTLSAKERYKIFVQTYPSIEQSVKNYHIASFLGITTESLSRIRKEIASE